MDANTIPLQIDNYKLQRLSTNYTEVRCILKRGGHGLQLIFTASHNPLIKIYLLFQICSHSNKDFPFLDI